MARRALHPRRRPGRREIGIGVRRLVLIAGNAARRLRRIGAVGERIVLSDQSSQFPQRIALGACRRVLFVAVIVAARSSEWSTLISISHRGDAPPSGKLPTRFYKRTDCRQVPSHIPMRKPLPLLNYRISSGASTPKMAKPDARTETTPWTSANRAFVISASLFIMKRK